MQIAMVGLGRMGANMVRRLIKGGHECVVYDNSQDAVQNLIKEGAKAVGSSGLKWVDLGTSNGVFGLDRRYYMMIGGEDVAVQHLDPIKTLAPGIGSIGRTPGRDKARANHGGRWLPALRTSRRRSFREDGPQRNRIRDHGFLREGLNILKHANAGNTKETFDAETAPMREPDHYKYDLPIAEIAEVWRRDSVIASWLLDLTAAALVESPDLKDYSGRVSDSGEGRWTAIAAIDEGVPADVLSAALFSRFTSQTKAAYANKLLSAIRYEFGGHKEKKES